uniref:uncharacterized protein LOC100179735 isoform X2 n=1 Tax=Ciona intestinalis TaxID=7719 RepID=UPI0000521915|nr:uncharacterized protein LOC100179735 isoform X2 [Ciona intestinalis]|eukprot:XP_002131021.1 uncharacterized protein LOC100179735 isoform X2 [Ciona intestinalis]
MNIAISILAILAVVLVLAHDTTARPTAHTTEQGLYSRLISRQHVRTSARKRHADIRIQSEIARRHNEIRRIAALNNLVNQLDTNKIYSMKVYPTLPAHSTVNPELLAQLNGQKLPGGVKIKVVHGKQHRSARNGSPASQFHRHMREAQQAITLAKTCRDMQEMIARNNLRLRVRCHMSGRHHGHVPLPTHGTKGF